jgi:hypothetical protein
MGNKQRVTVSIDHRDKFSLGDNRNRLGHCAFHWGILILPKKQKGADSKTYDASDGSMPDPLTRQELNPNHDWRFRYRMSVNPWISGRLLGRIMVGKVPANVTDDEIEAVLRKIPLPVKNADPEQNCHTWILTAIQEMQKNGLAEAFDMEEFNAKALELADEWLQNPDPKNFHNFTNRPT